MTYNEYLLSFHPVMYGEQPDIALFVSSDGNQTYYPSHAALIVQYDHATPENSIIVQTNAGFSKYGIYYTKINTNYYFGKYDLELVYLVFDVRSDVR